MDNQQLVNQLNREFLELTLLFEGMAETSKIPNPILTLAKVKTANLNLIIESLINQQTSDVTGSAVLPTNETIEPIILFPIDNGETNNQIVEENLQNEDETETTQQTANAEIVAEIAFENIEDKPVEPETFTQELSELTKETENTSEQEQIVTNPNQETIRKPLLGEVLGGNKHSIADFFAEKTESLSAKLELQPIADLRKAININDRFRFQRELFGNNANNYNAFIELINNANSFDDAKTIFVQHIGNNEHNETAKEFLILLQRRFINP